MIKIYIAGPITGHTFRENLEKKFESTDSSIRDYPPGKTDENGFLSNWYFLREGTTFTQAITAETDDMQVSYKYEELKPVVCYYGRYELLYTGPFRTYKNSHVEELHGVSGLDTCRSGDNLSMKDRVVRKCLTGIQRADLFFAWLGDDNVHPFDDDPIGTIAEIGFAKALNKYVVVARAPNSMIQNYEHLWFPERMASQFIEADTPEDAFRFALKYYTISRLGD